MANRIEIRRSWRHCKRLAFDGMPYGRSGLSSRGGPMWGRRVPLSRPRPGRTILWEPFSEPTSRLQPEETCWSLRNGAVLGGHLSGMCDLAIHVPCGRLITGDLGVVPGIQVDPDGTGHPAEVCGVVRRVGWQRGSMAAGRGQVQPDAVPIGHWRPFHTLAASYPACRDRPGYGQRIRRRRGRSHQTARPLKTVMRRVDQHEHLGIATPRISG